MGVQADRLYLGDTLVWDGAGQDTTSVHTIHAGTGEIDLVPGRLAVTRVEVNAAVRLRIYATAEGRTADASRSIYTPYPGGRCLVYELNATSPGVYDVAFLADSPLQWAADAASTVTLTWRSLA